MGSAFKVEVLGFTFPVIRFVVKVQGSEFEVVCPRFRVRGLGVGS